jgi:hypothetical protein
MVQRHISLCRIMYYVLIMLSILAVSAPGGIIIYRFAFPTIRQ